jgi:hypothetical protein
VLLEHYGPGFGDLDGAGLRRVEPIEGTQQRRLPTACGPRGSIHFVVMPEFTTLQVIFVVKGDLRG